MNKKVNIVDFIKLKIPAIAFAHSSSTPHVAKAKTTEKTAFTPISKNFNRFNRSWLKNAFKQLFLSIPGVTLNVVTIVTFNSVKVVNWSVVTDENYGSDRMKGRINATSIDRFEAETFFCIYFWQPLFLFNTIET